MGRKPCCLKEEVNRGAWSLQEDTILTNYIELHGEGNWRSLPQKAGLNRCGKSCRLRWMNYLRPGIKRGNISPEEEDLIIRLHRLLGNRWSLIAGRLPGRTDNEIKNYWNSVLSKKLNGDISKPSNQRHECAGTEYSLEKYRSGPTVITPKATRCTNNILISLDHHQGKQLMNNNQYCPPSSTPPDFDDESMLESEKDNIGVQMSTANSDFLDLSQTWIEDMFEKSNMFESSDHQLAPMFEMEFQDMSTSLQALEDEWRYLL